MRGLAAFEMDINSPSSNILGRLDYSKNSFMIEVNAPVSWILGHT